MSSDEFDALGPVTSLPKKKGNRKVHNISLDSGQRCIASAIAKIVNRMVNKELQQRCKELLEMEDLDETEARILYILQQIDKEREVEVGKKNTNKKQKKMEDPSNLEQD